MKKLFCLIFGAFFTLAGCFNGKYGPLPCTAPLPAGIYEFTTKLQIQECPFKQMFRTNTELVVFGKDNELLQCGFHESATFSFDSEKQCDVITNSFLITGAEFIHGDGSIEYICLADLRCTDYYTIELYLWTAVEE